MDCLLTPIGASKVSAGYEATPVCSVIARVNNPDGRRVEILDSNRPNEGSINEEPVLGSKGARVLALAA